MVCLVFEASRDTYTSEHCQCRPCMCGCGSTLVLESSAPLHSTCVVLVSVFHFSATENMKGPDSCAQLQLRCGSTQDPRLGLSLINCPRPGGRAELASLRTRHSTCQEVDVTHAGRIGSLLGSTRRGIDDTAASHPSQPPDRQ